VGWNVAAYICLVVLPLIPMIDIARVLLPFEELKCPHERIFLWKQVLSELHALRHS
jgi:hypothetical protein